MLNSTEQCWEGAGQDPTLCNKVCLSGIARASFFQTVSSQDPVLFLRVKSQTIRQTFYIPAHALPRALTHLTRLSAITTCCRNTVCKTSFKHLVHKLKRHKPPATIYRNPPKEKTHTCTNWICWNLLHRTCYTNWNCRSLCTNLLQNTRCRNLLHVNWVCTNLVHKLK